MLLSQLVQDWIRCLLGEDCDSAGGLLVPFGSTTINVGDKDSDIDLVLIVSDLITTADFIRAGVQDEGAPLVVINVITPPLRP